MAKSILFFADKLAPHVGGMEIHASYFIQHFKKCVDFPLKVIISKDDLGKDIVIESDRSYHINLIDLPKLHEADIVFFNSGRWIEQLQLLKSLYPDSQFVYRTGGNEIVQASLSHKVISDHKKRQAYWVDNINRTIDVLITNSAFTDTRLKNIGIQCQTVRCVGGVDTGLFKHMPSKNTTESKVLFCAARFVPYKNHHLLINVFHQLIQRGLELELRLAGDGPLMFEMMQQVERKKLSRLVKFLGPLVHSATCAEIANADIYIQLSTDFETEVTNGSYIHTEGMGRSILEALTAGTFIVAGNCGALSEIITPDRGLLITLDNVDQVTSVIERTLRSPINKQPILEKYSWKHIFQLYEQVFIHEHTHSH